MMSMSMRARAWTRSFSHGLMGSGAVEVAARAESATGGGGAPVAVCPYAQLERAHEEMAALGAPEASMALVLSLASSGRTRGWAYIQNCLLFDDLFFSFLKEITLLYIESN